MYISCAQESRILIAEHSDGYSTYKYVKGKEILYRLEGEEFRSSVLFNDEESVIREEGYNILVFYQLGDGLKSVSTGAYIPSRKDPIFSITENFTAIYTFPEYDLIIASRKDGTDSYAEYRTTTGNKLHFKFFKKAPYYDHSNNPPIKLRKGEIISGMGTSRIFEIERFFQDGGFSEVKNGIIYVPHEYVSKYAFGRKF